MNAFLNLIRRTPLLHLSLYVGMRALTTLACAVILFAAPMAFAQAADAGTQGDVDAVMQGAQLVLHTAQDPTSPKYLVVIAAIFVLCQLFKRFGHRIPVVGSWLVTHPWGDWVVGVVVSILGALVSSVGAQKGFDAGILMSALVAGMASSGTPLAIFGSGPAPTPPSDAKAEAAGAAASGDATNKLNG